MNYIHWNPSADIINLGFYAIRWYGVLWAIGLIGASYIVARLFKENKIDDSKFVSLLIYVLFGVLLGARLGHCLFYEPTYFFGSFKHFVEMLLPIRFLSDGGWRYTGYAGPSCTALRGHFLCDRFLFGHITLQKTKGEDSHWLRFFLGLLPHSCIHFPFFYRIYKRGTSRFRTTFDTRHGANTFTTTRCHRLLFYVESQKQVCKQAQVNRKGMG